jgi:hypothetical protein
VSKPPRDPEELGAAAEPVRGEIAPGTALGAAGRPVALVPASAGEGPAG